MRREPCDALNLGPGIRLGVPRLTVAVVLLALAKVDAACQLADDIEVRAAANISF
jgi:hypothetical protein